LLPSRRNLAESGFGIWGRRRSIIAAVTALVLLPIEVSNAAWLSDVSKGPPKRAALAKPAASTKARAAGRSIVLNPTAPKPVATACDPAKFRIVLDVGHTAKSEGAISARHVAEFVFNLRLAQRIEEKLKAEGFTGTRLLLTEGNARASLIRRVATANKLSANLFLSIHHDSVPNSFLENWEFEGRKNHFSDRFSGYSVYVSRNNPDFKTSLRFGELLGKEMKAQGLEYARQYTQAIMGRYQHPLLDKETGLYSYDKLYVLRSTQMPAVLLEAGSIINRDEELKMASPERRDIVSNAVATAVKELCESRRAIAARP
jgi:N-acetylmuramoyl-L-alanine amidase